MVSFVTYTLTQKQRCSNKQSSQTAQKATCSCGEQSALHCTCAKANTENVLEGPRCSCRARPAGQCTCDRASTENAPVSGSTCQCGARPASKCYSPYLRFATWMLTFGCFSWLHLRESHRWRLQPFQRDRLHQLLQINEESDLRDAHLKNACIDPLSFL